LAAVGKHFRKNSSIELQDFLRDDVCVHVAGCAVLQPIDSSTFP
jgi:hypothetical protein